MNYDSLYLSTFKENSADLKRFKEVRSTPNLFSFATSELSQDAFICWLLSWAKSEYAIAGKELHTCALSLCLSGKLLPYQHHQVMQKQTDDQVAVPMAEGAKKRFSALNQVSYDKGFWSPGNLEKLEVLLERAVLPKKGKLSGSDKKRESHPEFIRAKRKHSAVESDINALEANGLDKCPDKGIEGFKRYVALAVVAGNLKRLGKIILSRGRQ